MSTWAWRSTASRVPTWTPWGSRTCPGLLANAFLGWGAILTLAAMAVDGPLALLYLLGLERLARERSEVRGRALALALAAPWGLLFLLGIVLGGSGSSPVVCNAPARLRSDRPAAWPR